MPQSRKITRISNQLAYPLMLNYLMLILSLQSNLFLWVSLIAILFILWRFLFQIHKTSLPTNGVLNLLALVCCALIFYFSLSEGVLNGMTNLLLIGTAMKLLAIKTDKGVKQLCLALYFIIASSFIFKQGIGFTGYVFSLFILNTYTLIIIHSPALSFSQRIRYALRFFVVSTPLILFLFTLMPRLDPLWKMPSSKGTSTGLSENINPGDFSNLARSPDLAFRATFDTPVPAQKNLYWRTMVHEAFDGKQWTIHPFRKTKQNVIPIKFPHADIKDNVFSSYQLIIEPTYQSWLYTLDTPIKYNGLLDYHNDRLLSSRRVISQKFQYQVTSATKHQHQNNLSAFERNINLQIPPNSNLRSLSLAKQLRDQASSDLNYTQRVLQYFLNNPFSYTLEPPLLPVDPVDNFLFETRAGFCSHFASSFALLMRAGGIPARIVSGYQGGERADSGDYLSVYQYDAHAWNEIWLDNRWVRVDPTATVSPDRINFGLQQAMKDGFLAGELFDLAKYRQFALASWLRDQLNDMDFYWSAWVLNFDTKKQSKLFESLWGKPDTMMFSIYTALIFIGFIGIVYFLARRQHFKHDKTALFLLHRQITIVGRKFDFVLPVSTPPLTYLSELAAAQPQLAGDINALRQDYNRCLYQQLDDEQYTKALANIKRLIKNVKHAAPGPLARISKFRYAR